MHTIKNPTQNVRVFNELDPVVQSQLLAGAFTATKTTPSIGRTTSRVRRTTKRAIGTITPEITNKVYGVFTPTTGYALADIVKATGLPLNTVKRVLLGLRKNKKIYMYGSLRFARYAMSKDVAKTTSIAAKTGGGVKTKRTVKRVAKKTKMAKAA